VESLSGLKCFATLINYIDRLTVVGHAPVITKDLNLSITEYGSVATWFLFAYTTPGAFGANSTTVLE
jgi:hypothetical protein